MVVFHSDKLIRFFCGAFVSDRFTKVHADCGWHWWFVDAGSAELRSQDKGAAAADLQEVFAFVLRGSMRYEAVNCESLSLTPCLLRCSSRVRGEL